MFGGEGLQQNTPFTTEAQSSTLDALKRLRAPGRPRAQSYRTLDGLSAARDNVAWYWRLVAVVSSFMILGGFLMLPPTFEKEPGLRVGKAVVGIFAVALLAAGFSFTALLVFAVRNPLFQADHIYLPALTSCALGLLTVLYSFLVFSRYTWNTPALLVTVVAAVSAVIYGCLLIWTQRRIGAIKAKKQEVHHMTIPLAQTPAPTQHRGSEVTLHQENSYYENYNRNLFPSAYTPTSQPPPNGYDPNTITEEEMQRQQMLMLLLNKDHPSTPDPSQSTFRIDWQGKEEDEAPPNGHYTPQSGPSSAYPSSAIPSTAYPSSGISRQGTNELRPWDGVWREVRRPPSQELREARRRDIEQGSRRH